MATYSGNERKDSPAAQASRRISRQGVTLWLLQALPGLVFAAGFAVFGGPNPIELLRAVGLMMVSPAWIIACAAFAIVWYVMTDEGSSARRLRSAGIAAMVTYLMVGSLLTAVAGGINLYHVVAAASAAFFPLGNAWAAVVVAAVVTATAVTRRDRSTSSA